jgi:hypothetical protein
MYMSSIIIYYIISFTAKYILNLRSNNSDCIQMNIPDADSIFNIEGLLGLLPDLMSVYAKARSTVLGPFGVHTQRPKFIII